LERFPVVFDLRSAMPNRSLVNALAASFLAGEMNVELVAARGMRTLGRRWRWLRPLARRHITTFGGRMRPRSQDVIRFLKTDEGFLRACSKYAKQLSVKHWLNRSQRMLPVPAARSWNVPPIETAGALAEWLGITIEELLWFADLKGLRCRKSSRQLRHYHYRILIKRSGAVRLIEAPKARLKALQKQILTQILNKVPPHPAAHGFLKGRSIKTFAAAHTGKRVVVRMDLRDFFPTIGAARIQSFFRTAGYPEPVADLLAGICTNAAPHDVWKMAGFDVDSRALAGGA
jgi:RNA-directed DNA polymerase